MEALKELIPLAIALSLGLLVTVVGLDAPARDLLTVLRRPGKLAPAILAVNVITPLAAIALVHMIPIGPTAKAGVILMAISPVPPLVPGKLVKVSGRKDYAYGLYAALVLVGIFAVPLWVEAIRHIFKVDMAIPPLAVARNVVVSVLFPLAVGVAIRRAAPGFAERAAPIVYKAAMILLLVAALPVIVRVWPAIVDLAGDGTFMVMAATVIIAYAAGALLGGADLEDKAALAAAASTRHPGIAMLIAKANFDNPQIAAAVLGFLLAGLAVSIPCQLLLKRSMSARQAPS